MVEQGGRRSAAGLAEDPADLAYRAMLAHGLNCPRCLCNWRECPTRRALAAILREAHR